MTKRLLVGMGETAELNAPRSLLLDLLPRLRALDVETQVAAFADGPVVDAFAAVTEVGRLDPLPPGTSGARAQGAVRRISPVLAGRVQDLRTREGRRWIRAPDAIHLHGARAMPLLRYVTSPDIPVTVYVHPWDWSIAGLPPRDRRELVARTRRFLVADPSVVEPLLAAGVDPARIEPMPDPTSLLPAPPASATTRARARARRGLPWDRRVVTILPVPDWAAMPDLTLGLAWEVERLGGPGAPLLVWWGMPTEGDRRWPIDHDIAHMGLRGLRLLPHTPSWDDIVELSDAVVLPIDGPDYLPSGFAATAARRATPLLCWEDHPRAAEVARWHGTVTAQGDVEAMAAKVWSTVESPEALRRARYASWGPSMADAERVLPLGVPVP